MKQDIAARTTARNLGLRTAAMVALTAATFTGTFHSATAQESTPVDAAATTPYPVTIHEGTCGDYLARPAHILDEAQPREGMIAGATSAAAVISTTSTIDLTLDTLLADQPLVLVVYASPDDFDTPLACGELGGVRADDALVTALRPVADSRLAGLAVLAEDAGLLQLEERRVDLTVHVFTLEDPEAPGVTAPVPVEATAQGFTNPEWLVDAPWLEQHLDQVNTRIIGVQQTGSPTQGNVPGAFPMPAEFVLPQDTSDETLHAWRDDLALQVGSLLMGRGVDPWSESDTIILYDSGTMDAAALWWALDYLGHQDKRILEGGWSAWVNHWGAPPDTVLPVGPLAPVRTTGEELPRYPAQFRDERLATLDNVTEALAKDDVVLVDSRPAEQFAAAHIPGAVNVPASENLASEGQGWRSPDELHERYAAAGIGPDVTIIVYGDAGPDAAVTYLTLRLLGHEQVSLYPPGWDEWGRYPDLPRSAVEPDGGA